MPGRGFDSWAPWKWALVLVIALHLLSTSGTWWITDHGETLAAAHQFLTSGKLDLQGLGPGWEEWSRIAATRHSTTTRFLPLAILSLAPFLLIDHAFGWRNPEELRFVHLQGHFFVGLALLMVGRFVARATASSSSAALCVLLAGFNWPVWMIARRLGPEPILLALLAAFVTGGSKTRIAVLVLLPWTHATGPLIGLGAILWVGVEAGFESRPPLARLAASWVFGVASLALLWNLPVHGHLLLGGYDRFASNRAFDIRNPLIGLVSLMAPMLLWVFPLWWLSFKSSLRIACQIMALWVPLVALLALLSHPELLPDGDPQRRLAPLVAASLAVCLSQMNFPGRTTFVTLSMLALVSGIFGLASDFVAITKTPLGVFSGPHLLFLRLAFEEGRPWVAGSAVALLTFTALFAASKTLRLLVRPEPAVGSNDVPRPESKL